jgi:UDP-3-O-[3-hydroxymyristoyl] glucosamine N-acyltransferase
VRRLLARPDLAPNLVVADDVRIPSDTTIGANVVIKAGVELGEECVIEDGAVLGKTPVLARHSSAPRRPAEPLSIETGAVVCTGAVVFAGARVGARTIIGDQTHVRERAQIGRDVVVGRGSAIGNDAHVGDRVRIQTGVWLTGYSLVEDDVFLGPGVVTTNDDTMARCGPDYELRGPRLRRACRIGGRAVLTPGVEIGEEAFVAAGSVVTRDVRPRAFVMGVPAREVRSVSDQDLLERWR